MALHDPVEDRRRAAAKKAKKTAAKKAKKTVATRKAAKRGR